VNTTTLLAAEAMRTGSPAAKIAHAALFERIIGRTHRYFLRMIRDSHEAEECLQQTLVLLEQSLVHKKYEAGRSFNTWMWLKAHTVFAQWCRARERKMATLPDAGLIAGRSDPVGSADAAIDAETILRKVREELGEEVYEIFVLYYEGGLTQAEVSVAVERDRKTVRKRLAEAHSLIDRLLSA
jgi:RNA polymerase sigma factor (sigma-70 family)